MITLATWFTLARLLISPLILPPLILFLAPTVSTIAHVFLVIVFGALALTDLIDGILARTANQETMLGKQLDPLADKMLVLSALLPLLAIGQVSTFIVLVILGREFWVMGMREIAVSRGFSLPVMWLGKLKTAIQMLYIALILLQVQDKVLEGGSPWWVQGVALVTLLSALSYTRLFIRLFNEERNEF